MKTGLKRLSAALFVLFTSLSCVTPKNLLCVIAVPEGTWRVEHYGGDECTVEPVRECEQIFPEVGRRDDIANGDLE